MSFSRISVLAVFLMMVMSAFVVVPTYNVGADTSGCIDYEDTNGNGAYDEGEPCHDGDGSGDGTPPGEGEGCIDYEDTNGNGVFDVDEPCHDGPGFEIDSQSVLVEMISLSQWDVNLESHFSVEGSNEMRYMIAEMCDMLVVVPSAPNTISQPCLDAFIEMMTNDSFEGSEPDMCDAFGLTDDQCEDFTSCQEGGGLSCMRVMEELCGDTTSPGPYDMCSHWEYSDMMTIVGAMFDYEAIASPTEGQATTFLELIENTWGNDHYQPEDIANYDVYHFDISDEEVANYTVDIHGVYNETTGEGFEPTYVYLYEGTLDYPTSDEVPWIGGNDRVCKYTNDTEMYVDCSNSIGGLLEVGAYSMFITNSCNHQWEYNESSDRHDFVGYDCRYGSYNLSVYNDDNGSHVDDIVGNISTDDPEFIFAEVHKNHRDYSEEFSFFPYYDTHNYQLTAGDDTSYFYSDQDEDHNLIVWLYSDSFDPTQWSENLMYVSSGYENYDDLAGYDYNHSYFNMSEFDPGTYVFVTTGMHTHSNGSYNAGVYAKDEVALASWSGQLDDSDDRAYFTYGHHEYYQYSDHGDDGDDFGKSIFDNIEDWRDGSKSGVGAANGIVAIFWAADEAGVFHGDNNNHCEDGHCDDSHCEDGHCGGDSHCDDGHCGEEHHCDDGHCNASDGGHCEDGHCGGDGNHCNDGHCGDGPDEGECPFTDQDTCEELRYICDTEGGDGNSVRCGQEVAHYCMENDDPGCDEITTACTPPINAENASICAAYNDFNHDAFHAEHDDDGGVYLDGIEGKETPHNWDDEMGTFNPENIVGDIMLHDNSSIMVSNEFVITFNPVDNTLSEHIFEIVDVGDDTRAMRYHCWSEPGMSGYEMEISFDLVNDGTEDCGDGADEPQDMDGDGINDSWFDCNDPTGTQVNMEKTNDGTEDCPNGADEGVYLGDEPDFNFTFSVLPEYEIISCINCTDSLISADKTTVTFTADNDNIGIVFRDVVTQPACDHTIGIDDAAYAFNSAELDIKVGETVCWQWENTSEAHNVIEIDVAYDASLNITDIMTGFNSGAVSNSGDFRHTFTEDDMTHYYICEPHAQMGMVGSITVGNGSEEKEEIVDTAIEESGLPSVSFIAGLLVLVGAAGLRRRIH